MKKNFVPDFSNKDIDNSLSALSISKVLDYIKKPFDKVGVATRTSNAHFEDEDSIYYHKTAEEIVEMWEEKAATSCRYGSLLDTYIGHNLNEEKEELEMFKMDNGYDWDERLKSVCNSFDNFYKVLSKSGDTVFVTREKDLYLKVKINENQEVYVKGRFDALFYNKKTKKWIIIDWKSNEEIKRNNKFQKMLGPCFQYDDCDYIRYSLQVYFYKRALLEGNYLPKGTTENDIEVLIVHMPGKIVKEDKDFDIIKPAFPYNSELLTSIFKFAFQKDAYLKSKNKKE